MENKHPSFYESIDSELYFKTMNQILKKCFKDYNYSQITIEEQECLNQIDYKNFFNRIRVPINKIN